MWICSSRRAPRRAPSHLLFLDHAFADDLVRQPSLQVAESGHWTHPPCPEDIRPKTAIDTPHRWPGHDGSGLPATVAWLLRRQKRCPRPPDVPRRPFPLRRSRVVSPTARWRPHGRVTADPVSSTKQMTPPIQKWGYFDGVRVVHLSVLRRAPGLGHSAGRGRGRRVAPVPRPPGPLVSADFRTGGWGQPIQGLSPG